MDLLKLLSINLDSEEFLEALTTARLIWLHRNALVFQNVFSAPGSLVSKATQYIEEYHQANSSPLSEPIMQEGSNSWQKPSPDTVKVNWDAAIARDVHKMGVGVVIRNADGLCVGAMAVVIPHVTDPTTVEALGAWRAVLLCRDLGLSNIVLEGDSKIVVSEINGSSQCLSSFGHIVESTREQLRTFPFAEVQYTGRNANQATHVPSKSSVKFNINCVWMDETFSYIHNIVIGECGLSL
jgi:ribonuclease HI